jgi:pimeloyl-ACP methyl ester carboxylesterase
MAPLRRKSLAGMLAALALSTAFVAGRAARSEVLADFRPARTHPVAPSHGALASVEAVTFPDPAGNAIVGWWLASKNGAAVVFLHGTGADRTQLVPQATGLAELGYGVLLYDSPGHGESTGPITWSRSEPLALRGALAFAQKRGAVHLGVVGFSAGSMIAVHEAGASPSIEGLVLEGVFDSFEDVIRLDFKHLGPLTAWPAVWAARWAGFRPSALGSVESARCPALFVEGSRDTDVPLRMSEQVIQAYRGPKESWVVSGATHGEYQRVAGPEFDRRLALFFDRVLHPTL